MSRRKFRASIVSANHGAGIGIIETADGTTYISSIYEPGKHSRRSLMRKTVEHVHNVAGDDPAIIRINSSARYSDVPSIRVRTAERSAMLTECNELANDALKRKTTIEERF